MMTKAERTRHFIVEKTASIFNSKGYSGTSMSDIMEATGLTKGCIYGNFASKDEIALAAFDYNFGHVNSLMRIKILEKKSAIEKLSVYPEMYKNFLSNPFIIEGCPILNTSIEADDTHPALRKRAINALQYWQSGIQKIIAGGIADNEIKADADGKKFAIILCSLIEGAVMQAKLLGKSDEIEVTMSFLQKMINDLKA